MADRRVTPSPESQSRIEPFSRSQGRSESPSNPTSWTSDKPLSALPVLTDGVRAQHKTGPFTVNLKVVTSSSNPFAVAVINKLAVYEGQTIHNTGMRLVKVAEEGLAVEISATGELYFVPFR